MRLGQATRHLLEFTRLPPRVSRFYLRALLAAVRHRDGFSLRSATRPRELRLLLRLAGDRRHVVEIGSGTGWTAFALALAHPARRVLTFDPCPRPQREWYIGLCGSGARSRVHVVRRRASDAAAAGGADAPVELLYVDGSHKAHEVVADFRAWRSRLAPGAVVAFHDWDNPAYPGVRQAIRELELDGHGAGDLYVWRAPGTVPGTPRIELPHRRMTPVSVAEFVRDLTLLPRPVAAFYVRARWRAARSGDVWSARAASKPRELRALIEAGRGARRVVEVGTGTGWSALGLALADPARTVVSYDIRVAPERAGYAELCDPAVLRRVRFLHQAAEAGALTHDEPVDLLFLDGFHDRDSTIAVFEAWRPHLAPGAVVAFHDWREPAFPGVEEAVVSLGLDGHGTGHLYVWRAPRE